MTLEEILLSDNIIESINNNIDYLLKIIPEIKDMIGFDHKHPHHHLDVWNHTLLALSLSPKDFDIRLSLLLQLLCILIYIKECRGTSRIYRNNYRKQ